MCDSHAIIILTEWDAFKEYPYAEFYKLMEKPSYIFDGRNILSEEEMISYGFTYHRVGKRFTNQWHISFNYIIFLGCGKGIDCIYYNLILLMEETEKSVIDKKSQEIAL